MLQFEFHKSKPWCSFGPGSSSVYGRICMEWDILAFGVEFPSGGFQPGDKILMVMLELMLVNEPI